MPNKRCALNNECAPDNLILRYAGGTGLECMFDTCVVPVCGDRVHVVARVVGQYSMVRYSRR